VLPVWHVCFALCKCICLHSAQHTRHAMPPQHWQRLHNVYINS